MFEISQCFWFVPAFVSVSARYGVVDATCSVQFGVVVPIPKLPIFVIIAFVVSLENDVPVVNRIEPVAVFESRRFVVLFSMLLTVRNTMSPTPAL